MKSILHSFHFELIDICDLYLFEMRLISLRDGEVCSYNTTMLLLFHMCYSLTVCSDAASQVLKRRNLTWKRSEVLAWHIPLPDTVHFLFSSKMKPGYTAPMRKSSRRKQNKSTYKRRQFIWLRMFKMSTAQTLALLELKMKEVRRATLIRTQGTAQNTNPSKDPRGVTVGAEAELLRLWGCYGLHNEFQGRRNLIMRSCLSQASKHTNEQATKSYHCQWGSIHPNFPDSSSSENTNLSLERQGEEVNFYKN